MAYIDLFGETVEEGISLTEKFIEPPFTTLDARSFRWQQRKAMWKSLGLKGELGREAKTFHTQEWLKDKKDKDMSDTSIFDPVLCELLYTWFVEKGGKVLDCFCGGSTRGIIANYLGYKYTGIDIRKEQIESNIEQSKKILSENNQPNWLVGDSEKLLDTINETFDFVFSCPPYFNLEVYSDLEGDISNTDDYDTFLVHYENIIRKACEKLKKDGFACFVVGEVRDKKGNYIGFVPDTINIFKKIGMKYYNEGILLTSLGTAMLRANGNMKNKKLTKTHQNILIFKKTEE